MRPTFNSAYWFGGKIMLRAVVSTPALDFSFHSYADPINVSAFLWWPQGVARCDPVPPHRVAFHLTSTAFPAPHVRSNGFGNYATLDVYRPG
jgi:hypothetical protein